MQPAKRIENAGAKRQRIKGRQFEVLTYNLSKTNPVESGILKVHSMVIRNEVTRRLLFWGSIPEVGANRMLRLGGIESEAKDVVVMTRIC